MSISELRTDAQNDDERRLLRSRVPDVSNVPLSVLRNSGNPHIVDYAERLTADVSDHAAASSGFSSAL